MNYKQIFLIFGVYIPSKLCIVDDYYITESLLIVILHYGAHIILLLFPANKCYIESVK